MENESVNKDHPQKMILETDYCNHQYPLRISSQNIVFVPGELSGASKNRYVFAPYWFYNTFLGIPESVRRRSVEYTRTDSKNSMFVSFPAIRFQVMTQIVFVLRGLVELGV